MASWMPRITSSLYAVAITLWVGALWSIGFISAPLLFSNLPDRHLAGTLAGAQFAAVAWIGLGCAAYILAYLGACERAHAFRLWAFRIVLLMLLLGLVGHFRVTPIVEMLRESLVRDGANEAVRSQFLTWHGVAWLLWCAQSLLGVWLVSLVARNK